MCSWSEDHYGETDSPAMRYQRGIDWRTREDMVLGTDTPDGYRKPNPPTCSRCFYVIVDGKCMGCLERKARRDRPAASVVETDGSLKEERDAA